VPRVYDGCCVVVMMRDGSFMAVFNTPLTYCTLNITVLLR
jgi:hypothetical protein